MPFRAYLSVALVFNSCRANRVLLSSTDPLGDVEFHADSDPWKTCPETEALHYFDLRGVLRASMIFEYSLALS